jgi:hypothetical protein
MTTPAARQPAPTAEVWEETLDSLEHAVQEASRLARHPHTAAQSSGTVAWVPPSPIGQLPAHLADRARELLRAIDTVEADLARAMEANLAELAGLARSVRSVHRPAAYVDVSA